tara:strand:- start:293 stop:1060 length:768 start_codon:yes stop_codon:yes gene_type:complete
MNTIAIIPARGGSKGIPQKNIKLLKGFPLVAYSIASAKLSKKIERVLVSTDSEEIAEIAVHFGAEVPFLRPAEYASDNSIDRDVVVHAMEWFSDNEKEMPEHWVYLRPTTPLRDPHLIDKAILQITNTPSSTSLRSGHKAPESPFKWFEKDSNGFFLPLYPENSNLAPSKTILEYSNLPRQLFEPVYVPNGYVDIIKASFALNSQQFFGKKMIGFETQECQEVDTLDELKYIEFQLENSGSTLLDFLQKSFQAIY